MIIVDFAREHIRKANALALACYKEELSQVPALPYVDAFPDLTCFADNGMGVAAFEDDEMIGFLCGIKPFDNAFHSTDVKGVFSPMWANAATLKNRANIYAAMYQDAARKWVRAGAVSHGICLYAHDEISQNQFFKYGFGLRCIDSIRPMEPFDCRTCEEYEFIELQPSEYALAYPLELMLNKHFNNSPTFMNRVQEPLDAFCETCINNHERCFVSLYQGKICAYLKISESGETFITEHPNYRHINSAFCLKEHRGKGLYQSLLDEVIKTLKAEGYTHLGVDFESINPSAYSFWSKYFTAYTHGVVRRIDERILSENHHLN
ncbi:MAG TPA: N-acetyltransferase [Lachnoclostridium sp.]|uniref:Acetyltransferase (GNAT) family protein n=1 Tax=[Clostridium] celerecrescens 18A TaxID=1286362 RepID=A0A2M8Z2G9_9FIRM|nr:GNAT family N-acetyltransferase [Lacrimispora celerecrescens]PJJ27632.1 acetyltransferase (GNAT) family protein [[Clostridium] celerecrescens 18A]HBE84861.1 N-acetyltransferase [Lachnoclostridium sp.]